MLADANRPGIGGEKINHPDQPSHQLASLYPPYEGPRIPSWIAYDKKVEFLCTNKIVRKNKFIVW